MWHTCGETLYYRIYLVIIKQCGLRYIRLGQRAYADFIIVLFFTTVDTLISKLILKINIILIGFFEIMFYIENMKIYFLTHTIILIGFWNHVLYRKYENLLFNSYYRAELPIVVSPMFKIGWLHFSCNLIFGIFC